MKQQLCNIFTVSGLCLVILVLNLGCAGRQESVKLDFLGELHFLGRTVSGQIDQGEIEMLLDTPLADSAGMRRDRQAKLELTKNFRCEETGSWYNEDKEKKIFVSTCRERDVAVADGYYAKTGRDMIVDSWFISTGSILKAYQQARKPERSFVSGYGNGISDLDAIPLSLLPVVRQDEADELEEMERAGIKMSELIRKYRVKLFKCSDRRVELEFVDGDYRSTKDDPYYEKMDWRAGMGGMSLTLILEGKADFNNDGNEDLLVSAIKRATHGTLSVSHTYIFSRSGYDQKFELTRL